LQIYGGVGEQYNEGQADAPWRAADANAVLGGVMHTILLLAIDAYKRFISPYKGFRCAYSSLHGGASCSTQVRMIVHSKGVIHGWADIVAQFAACKSAASILISQSADSNSDEEDDNEEKPKPKKQSKCWLWADVPWLSCSGFGGDSSLPGCDIPDCSCS